MKFLKNNDLDAIAIQMLVQMNKFNYYCINSNLR